MSNKTIDRLMRTLFLVGGIYVIGNEYKSQGMSALIIGALLIYIYIASHPDENDKDD